MHSFPIDAKEQYTFVQSSRKALLDYCSTISQQDFVNENTSFGKGTSMRNLLLHIANTYEHWIAKIALKKTITYSNPNTNNNIGDVIKLFQSVDSLMIEFIGSMQSADNEIEFQLNNIKTTATPFKLFTHVITHEYHHKGQILLLSRMLGYVPVDTDVVR